MFNTGTIVHEDDANAAASELHVAVIEVVFTASGVVGDLNLAVLIDAEQHEPRCRGRHGDDRSRGRLARKTLRRDDQRFPIDGAEPAFLDGFAIGRHQHHEAVFRTLHNGVEGERRAASGDELRVRGVQRDVVGKDPIHGFLNDLGDGLPVDRFRDLPVLRDLLILVDEDLDVAGGVGLQIQHPGSRAGRRGGGVLRDGGTRRGECGPKQQRGEHRGTPNNLGLASK